MAFVEFLPCCFVVEIKRKGILNQKGCLNSILTLCACALTSSLHFRIKGKTQRQTTGHTIQMCSTITCSGLRLTHMGLYNMHNINIYNHFRSPPDRHPQLVLDGWRLQWWLLGGSPYSSRLQAWRRSEHTPHESENARISIRVQACLRPLLSHAMPLTPFCAIRGKRC